MPTFSARAARYKVSQLTFKETEWICIFFSIWLIGRFADGNCRGGSTDGISAWFIPEARVLIVMNEQVALQSA